MFLYGEALSFLKGCKERGFHGKKFKKVYRLYVHYTCIDLVIGTEESGTNGQKNIDCG